MQGNMHEIQLPLLASATASSTVKTEHKGLWHKTSLAQLAAVAEALTGLAEPSAQLLPCHWQQRKSSLLWFRAEGKVRKGRGRLVSAKAPACAFPELCGKNFKGLDYPEDQACAYPKKLF